MSKQDSVTSVAFTERSLRGRVMRAVTSRSDGEWGSERWKNERKRRRRCQREFDREGRTTWYRLKTVGDMGGNGMGKSGKTESGERARVQAQRGTNPMTLLGSRLHLHAAPLQLYATTERCGDLIRETTALQTHCALGEATLTEDHSRVWTLDNPRGLTSSCLMAPVAPDQGPCWASDAHAPIEAQIRREAVFLKPPPVIYTDCLCDVSCNNNWFYSTDSSTSFTCPRLCRNLFSWMGVDYDF